MNLFERREFLQQSSLLAATAALSGPTTVFAAPATKAGSANDKLRVAVVGVRSRGKTHIGGFAGKNNCEVAVICDCDEAVIADGMQQATKAQGSAPKYVKDIRKVLEDKSIDIISIATPNHWHALMAVWGMRAGKDVYCEKPATHNLREGRLMVEAARKYGRLCQVGTQSRSNPGMRQAIEFVRSGKIGEVNLAYGTCYKPRNSIGLAGGEQTPPASMDYDLWTGPAALKNPHRKTKNGTVHYDWHWIWEYGNGDFGNQGVHEADKARWGLNVGLPTSVVSVGGRVGYQDDGETPNTQLNVYSYPGGKQIIFEVRGLNSTDYKGAKVGNIWFGEKGYVVCPNYSSGIAYDKDGAKIAEFKGGGDQLHFDNFVAAVRSRKQAALHCDVEEGHMSAALCHLGNISYRLGTATTLATPAKALSDNTAAIEAYARMQKHLAENKVDLKTAQGLMGATLTFDPKSESFTAAGEALSKAKAMLFRDYRKGFDITEAV
jgi:predicted dehydrogenase